MNHAALVKVADACDQLFHYFNYICLSDLVVLQELKQFSTVNLLHHYEHPSFRFVDLSHLNHIRMTEETHDLNFVAKELFFTRVQLGLVDLLQGVRDLSAFVFCFKHLGKLATAEPGCLRIKVIHAVELAVVLELADPSVNDCFVFVEKSALSEVVVICVQSKSKHVVLVLDLLKVESL